MRILLVFGTRPEIIKLGPVYRALNDAGADIDVFWSGQHVELADGLLDLFGMTPTYRGAEVVLQMGLAGKHGVIMQQIDKILREVRYDDAGRVMAFDGSMVLESGINAWREVVERLPKSKAAVHAQVALALPAIRNYRVLRIDAPEAAVALGGQGAFQVSKANVEEGRRALDKALLADPGTAMATLGRVDYEYYCGHFRAWLTAAGGEKYAKKVDDIFRKIARSRDLGPRAKRRTGAGKTRV